MNGVDEVDVWAQSKMNVWKLERCMRSLMERDKKFI
jgi:hypothetical protein